VEEEEPTRVMMHTSSDVADEYFIHRIVSLFAFALATSSSTGTPRHGGLVTASVDGEGERMEGKVKRVL
jgi:hypothetical protein